MRSKCPNQAGRRRFLRGAVALFAAAPLARVWANAPPRRTLSFVHTHTQEQLTSTYFVDGAYVPSELERINHLLRDFRTGDVHAIDPATLDILADLRTLAQSEARYEVICGYRSPQTNAMLRQRSTGVAEHSLHMQGRAIDVRLSGFPTARLHELALGMRRGGVGFYPQSDFVHIDDGAVRSW
jgi:uncharacterized protein YcbK (DUF882 family)